MNLHKAPLYQQVFELLSEKIASGHWEVGASIPNEIRLSEELRVSVGTIRKAVDRLEAEGLVSRRQGKGTFVRNQKSDNIRRLYDPIRNADGSCVDWRYIRHDILVRPSTAEEQKRFEIGPASSIGRITRTRAIGIRPAMVSTAFVPADRFRSLTDLTDPQTLIVNLADAAGIILGSTEEVVDICPVSAVAAAALSIEAETPVLRIQRIVRDSAGVPIETCVAQCHLLGEQYRAPVARYRDHVMRTENRFPSQCELLSQITFE